MVTENVDIRFRESGARVIKRRIDEIGESANQATRGIFLLQRAIFVLGGAGAVRALSRQADLLTNVENRLRLTTTSAQNLEAVQKRLFAVARDSRSSFEAVAEIYNRTALSVKNLGISQKETIRFTESLAKASILSGASTREANAALIQLSQGLASNRLSGDELRSVLEQLPFVADVIAKELGITRGELRKFGRDGKISAEVVLKAFRNASDEIDELFANTDVTIGQALAVANTNWLEFLDNLEDTFQISQKIGRAIIFLSENIDIIAKSLGAIALAFAVSFGIKQVQRVLAVIASVRSLGANFARLTEIENLRAAASVRRATAATQAATVDRLNILQGIAQLKQNAALLKQQSASIIIDSKRRVARSALTGQFIAYDVALKQNIRTNVALTATERALTASRAQLTAATATQTAATTTLTGAQARLGAANVATAGFGARLARTFPTIAGGLSLVARGLTAVWGLLLANPIGAAIAVIAGLTAAFFTWGDQIKVARDGLVSLKDVGVAAFQLIGEAVAPVINFISTNLSSAIEAITGKFEGFGSFAIGVIVDVGSTIYDIFTFAPRIAIAAIAGIVAAFDQLPAAAGAAGTEMANLLIAAFEFFANKAIAAINTVINGLNALLSFGGVGDFLGLEGAIPTIAPAEFARFENEYAGAGKSAGEAFTEGFSNSFEATGLENTVKSIADPILERAEFNATNRRSDRLLIDKAGGDGITTETTPGTGTGSGGGGGGGKSKKSFNEIISGLNQEIELLKLSTRERERAQEILKIEKELKRSLTQQERELADATLRSLELAKAQADILDSIVGPREEIAVQQQALNQLFKEGRIDIEDYTVAIRNMQAAADEASQTLAGGFRASINNAIMSASELGSALGDLVVGAAGKAADAIVEFAKTGEFNVKQFFGELFAQLLKLAAQQLLLQFLGTILGVPGVGLAGGATGGGGGLGFNTGGSILPSGPGSTDTQMVQFAKRPDERVDILTPGQQNAKRRGAGEEAAPVIAPPQVNVAVVMSEDDVVGAFAGQSGQTTIIRALEQNPNSARAAIGS